MLAGHDLHFSIKNEKHKPSRGGLEVETWTDNSLHSASVGLNPAWVWYINCSEVETLCRTNGILSTFCRYKLVVPYLDVFKTTYMPQALAVNQWKL